MKIRGNTVGTPMSVGVVLDDSKVCEKAWSSKNIIDRFCPSFTESGAGVRFAPVDGYPLNVFSILPNSITGYNFITMHQYGKNLVDLSPYKSFAKRNYFNSWKNGTWMGTTVDYLGVAAHIPITHLQGLTITVNYACGVTNPNGSAGIAFFDESKKYISGSSASTFAVPDNACYMRVTFNYNCPGLDAVQFELGDTITAFEAYKAPDVKTVEFPRTVFGGTFNWDTGELVSAQGGVKFSELDWQYDYAFGYFYADLPNDVDESAEMSCTGFEYRPGAYDDIVAGGSESDVFDVRGGRIVVYNPGNDNLADFIDYKATDEFDCTLLYQTVEPTHYDLEPFNIVGKEGVNTIITSPVVTTVSGKEDLLAVIEKLRAKE